MSDMNIALSILNIYPSLKPGVDFRCVNEEGVQSIASWNNANPQPTSDQLNAAWFNVQKAEKKASLLQSFGASLLNGFTSSADGTSRTYAIDAVAMGKWTGALAVINSGKATANMTVKDFSGNKVTLTPAQFQTMAADGYTYFNNQEQHLWSLEDQVDAITYSTDSATQATNVTNLNAITW